MLTPPLKWHGGKHYLAAKIVALMAPHTHYVEPYFGGGAVLLARDGEGVSEVVNDIDSRLTVFWNVLRYKPMFDEFVRLCQATPFSEMVWGMSDCEPIFGVTPAVQQAFNFFVRCRQSLAGRMTSFAPLSRTRTRRGMNEQVSAWLTAIEGLPAVHARLKRVAILNHDAIDVIKQQDGPDTLFYCDPPYLAETRSSPDVYLHEMSGADHAGLLDTLSRISGKFLLSGYDHSLYRSYETLFGWHRHEFELPNNAAGGDTKARKTEVVWSNYQC